MEDRVVVGSIDCQLHLHSRMEVGPFPTISAPPMLTVNLQHGSFTSRAEYLFLPQLRRILQNPNGWRRDVCRRFLFVLRRHPFVDVSFLVSVFCSYCDAALRRFSQLYGTRAISIDALIILASPSSVNLSLPGAALAAEPIDEVMMTSLQDAQGGGGGFGGTPASASAIREQVKIATFIKAEAEGADVEENCSICFDDFEPTQQLLVMPCRHRFHMGCLKEWLALSHVCPLCRFSLPVDES